MKGKLTYGVDDYSFITGNKIKDFDLRNNLFYNPGDGEIAEDYLDNVLGWPIYSQKFKNLLEDLKIQGLQFFNINIVNIKNGELLPGYYVVNIIQPHRDG